MLSQSSGTGQEVPVRPETPVSSPPQAHAPQSLEAGVGSALTWFLCQAPCPLVDQLARLPCNRVGGGLLVSEKNFKLVFPVCFLGVQEMFITLWGSSEY